MVNGRWITDDDQIETAIHIRIGGASITPPHTQSPDSSPVIPSVELGNELPPGHGQSMDGGVACCRQLYGNGLADCVGCLEYEWTSFNDSLDDQERSVAMQVLTVVREAGQRGVTKCDLQVCSHMSSKELDI
jgi:hypothetical protein